MAHLWNEAVACEVTESESSYDTVQQHPQNILSAHFGRYRDFGLYTDSLALYGKRMFYYVWDVPIFCLMGAVGGLMGALWVHVNVRVTAFRHRAIPVR